MAASNLNTRKFDHNRNKSLSIHRLYPAYPQFVHFKYNFVDKLLFLAIITLYYSQSDLLNDPPVDN